MAGGKEKSPKAKKKAAAKAAAEARAAGTQPLGDQASPVIVDQWASKTSISSLTSLEVSPEFGYTIFRHSSADGVENTVGTQFSEEGRMLTEVHDIYAGLHSEHYRKSERFIMEAVAHAPQVEEGKPRTAIILGGAPYRDIPLRRILAEGGFDRVDLVDLDETGARAAVEALPIDLQRKCRIIIADLTGGDVRNFGVSVAKAAQESRDLATFATRAREILQRLQSGIPNFGEPEGSYALAISHLVLSQLPVFPMHYLNRLAEEKFGVPNVAERIPELLFAFSHISGLGTRLQQAHVKFLANAVMPGGVVFFGDTFMKLVSVRDPLTHEIDARMDNRGPLIAWPAVGPIFRREFGLNQDMTQTVDDERYWNWHEYPPEHFPNGIGQSWSVMAFELRRPQPRREQ